MTMQLQLQGMSCAGCARSIEKALLQVPGVERVEVNFATEIAAVNGTNLHPQELIAAVTSAGYQASLLSTSSDTSSAQDAHQQKQFLQFVIAALLSASLLYTMVGHFSWTSAMPMPAWLMNPWWQLALATPVQFIIGAQFYWGSWLAIKNRAASMDVLVALGTSAAYGYSLYLMLTDPHAAHDGLYFETSAVLITLIVLGKWLEARAKGQASAALQQLLQLQPPTAALEQPDGSILAVPSSSVPVGAVVQVKPGQAVPLDGEVIEGHSAVNEAMLTGESLPIEKSVNDSVLSGTFNHDGFLRIRVTSRTTHSALARIVAIVRAAQQSKAPIQRLADRVAAVFVPVVLVIALLTGVAWWLWWQPGDARSALEAVVAVLVIACPCALGLATPTSILAGSGRAAQFGMLFKDSASIEQAAQIDTVLLDKTGTLTFGQPQLTDQLYSDDTDQAALNAIIVALEQRSEHPLAQAIVRGLNSTASAPALTDFKALTGRGVMASISYPQQPATVLIGTRRLLQEHTIAIDSWQQRIEKLESQGKTVMLVAVEQQLVAVLAVADQLRPEAKSTIAALQQQGKQVAIVSGDNQRTVASIASQLGIDEFYAEILPEKKAGIVSTLQQQGRRVAMVGDGVNDAPALATADLGIAMGSGADVALETARVALLTNDLSRLIHCFALSAATVANIRQNLFWAFAYNSLGIPIAAAGLLAPWLAGAAMALSSVSVVLNALRLQRWQPR